MRKVLIWAKDYTALLAMISRRDLISLDPERALFKLQVKGFIRSRT